MAGLEKMDSHLATILDLTAQEKGFTEHRKEEIVRIYYLEDTSHNADTIQPSLAMALTPNYSWKPYGSGLPKARPTRNCLRPGFTMTWNCFPR
jgi:hypothetical protein